MRAGGVTLAIAALALAGCAETAAEKRPLPRPDRAGSSDSRAENKAQPAPAAGANRTAPAALAAPSTPVASRGPSLSPERIAAFESRALPALPPAEATGKPGKGDFRGATVAPLAGDRSGALVEVVAKLRQGVDDELAFAYATCALAGWAAEHGGGYARPIRSVDRNSNATLTRSSVFTISKTRPVGLMVVNVKETLRECKSRGIPAA